MYLRQRENLRNTIMLDKWIIIIINVIIIAMTVVVVVVVAVICIQQTDNVMYSWCLLEAVSYIISKIDCNVMILEAVASLMDLPVE